MHSRDHSQINPREGSRGALGVALAFLVGAWVWPAASAMLLPSGVFLLFLACVAFEQLDD
jgi:hypothetical protein